MKEQANILVTGVTGFVGAAVVNYLLLQNYRVSVISRKPTNLSTPNMDVLLVGDLEKLCEPESPVVAEVAEKLRDIDVVVHCAGLAHNLNPANSVEPFYKLNRDVTAALAGLAAQGGVKRFVFISTIGVNGNETRSHLNQNLPEYFAETDLPNPQNDYARSKSEAEEALWAVNKSTGMEITIIRPPLIYGAKAKGNFALLKKVVDKNIPLPFASINNLRSFVALDNLVDFIGVCLMHPNAADQVFLIADGEDVSTADLLRQVAKTSGKRALLLPFPIGVLAWAAKLLGKQQLAASLFGSLRLDTTKARQLLGWRPVVTMQQQLGKMFSESDGGFPPARE